nr:hypothetical protein [Tanacetum cinerariifolium]
MRKFGGKAREMDKELFGNMDKAQNEGENSDCQKNVSEIPVTNTETDVTNNIHDMSSMNCNEKGVNANNAEGLKTVIEKGPWMVSNRPLIVKQWNIEIRMQKAERSKLPVWVRMTDVPLEAWSIEGISALTSSLGMLMIMDTMTASMCHSGIGRMDFARVLVEMDVVKEFKRKLKCNKKMRNKIKGVKKVSVTFDWKPAACTHCRVFGHDYNGCNTRPKTQEEVDRERIIFEEQEKSYRMANNVSGMNERRRNFNQVKNNSSEKEVMNVGKCEQSQYNKGPAWNRVSNKKQEYKRKQTEVKEGEKIHNIDNRSATRKKWPIKNKEFEAVKKTANKMVVDQYIIKKVKPSVQEVKDWTQDLIEYYKVQWEKGKEKDKDTCYIDEDEDDMVEELNKLEGNDKVSNQFVKHFQQFLGNKSNVDILDDCDDLFSTTLNQDDAVDMIREVSNKEIKNAIFDIRDNKALGPDGYSSLLLKRAWNIIGNDMCDAIKEFFESGKMLGEINVTLIALVPKI